MMSWARTHGWQSGVVTLLLGGSLCGGNLVTNGSFDTSTYTANHEFDTSFNSQGVSGWTGTGYSIYFFAGTQTTTSAISQWTSTLEMLDTASTKLSPNGGNFVALDADPSIGSTIFTSVGGLTVGQRYTLSFFWAASELQSRTGATNEQIQAQITNGATVDLNYLSASVNTASQGFTIDPATNNWFKVTLTFAASSATETLTFLGKSTSTGLPPMVLIDGVQINAVPEPTTLTMLGLGSALILGAAVRRKRIVK